MFLDILFEKRKSSRCIGLTIVFSLLAIVGGLCLYVYHGFQVTAVYPAISSDAFNYLVAAKIIAKEGWWFSATDLSWPTGLNYAGFPFDGNFAMLIFRFLSLFTSNPFAITAYALSVASFVCFGLAYFFLRLFGANRFAAGLFSLMFAFSPAFFYRSIPHFHSLPYFVPISCGTSLLLFCDKVKSLSKLQKKVILTLCFLLGFGYAYTVAFSLFFFFIALVRQCLNGIFQNKTLQFGILAVFLFSFGAGINLSPSLYEYYKHPELSYKMSSFKNPSEADYYGLYIRTLFRPVPSESAGYKSIENLYTKASFDRDTGEQLFGRLGSVASLGLVLIFFFFFFRLGVTPSPVFSNAHLFYGLGIFILSSLLLSVPGGLGSMINMFHPQIRCYNRISPYIGFLSFIGIAVWVTGIMSSYVFFKKKIVRILCFLGGLTFVIFAVCIDQRPVRTPLFTKNSSTVLSAQAMFQEFKPYLSSDAKIFSIPSMLPYPSTPGEGHMLGQMDALPYLVSNCDYSWSIMPLLPAQEALIKHIMSEPGTPMIEKAVTFGFDTFLVDTAADTPRFQQIVEQLELSGLEKHISSDGKYILFTGLKEYSNKDKIYQWDMEEFVFSPLPKELSCKKDSGEELWGVSLYKGWSQPESWGTWSNGYFASMDLKVAKDTKSIVLHGQPFLSEKHPYQRIVIKHQGKLLLETRFPQSEPIAFPIPSGINFSSIGVGSLSLDFEFPDAVSPVSLGINSDSRVLAFGIVSITLD